MSICYLVRGAKLKCMCGSQTGELELPTSHGSYVKSDPIVCEDDCEPITNIPTFGICKITNMPCIPLIMGKWLCAHKETKINGKSAITTNSALFCSCGGLILPEDSGQKEIQELLKNLPEEERLQLLNGLRTCAPYSADPVNLCTGNFVFEKEDLKISGTFPLSLIRTYNSLNKRVGVFGQNWTHNHEICLHNLGNKIEVIREDGCIETYKKSGNQYLALDGVFNILKQEKDGYLLKTKDKVSYLFNRKGECIEKIDEQDNKIHYTYEEGKLVLIENKGNQLYLSYGKEGKLISIWDHTKRKVNYIYNEKGFLEEIQNPCGDSYYYQYDISGKLEKIISPLGITKVKNEYDKFGRTINQTFPDGGKISYHYEDDKERVVLTEQNGNKIKYYRDEKFRNIRTVYEDGTEVTEYNDQDLKTYFKDKNGNEFHYEYDENGRLIKEVNPLGDEMKMEYNPNGLLKKIIAYDKSCFQFAYDKHNNLVKVVNPMGYSIISSYHTNGQPETIQMPDGSKIQLIYDEKMNIRKIINNDNLAAEYNYDTLNRVIKTIDGNGNQTGYEYDELDNLIKVTDAMGNQKKFEYDKQGKVVKIINYDSSVVSQKYNNIGRLCEVTDEVGRKTKFEYDCMWNLSKKTEANGGQTSYIYNKQNQLERIINPIGATAFFEYDANGNLIKEIDFFGREYHYKYNARNLKIETQNPEGIRTWYEYDPMGRIICLTDSLGNKTITQYNALGLKEKEIDTFGNETRYFYNSLGLITKKIDVMGGVTEYEYLPGGWLSKILYPDHTFLSLEYDKNQNIIGKTNQAGYRIRYIYDCLDRIIKIFDNEGAEKSYTYDAVGNVTSIQDANHNLTRYCYSAARELLEVEDALGNRSVYEYDEIGKIKTIKQYEVSEKERKQIESINKEQKEKRIAVYKRNLLGQILSIKDSIGNLEQFEYDNLGRVKERIDREGNQTRFAYSPTGDLEQISYADGKSVKYHYSSLKQLMLIEDWLGITKAKLDKLGRMEKVIDERGNEIYYEWNPQGNLKSMVYPDKTKIEYEYDVCGRVSCLKEGEKEVHYSYDKNGHLEAKELPNGIVTKYFYNKTGNLIKLEHTYSNESLDRYQYVYDKVGNKIKISKSRKGLREGSGFYEYEYDPLNRLKRVKKEEQEIREYGYDGFGNRTYLKSPEKQVNFYYNSENQLIQSEENGHITDYEYDRRGNVIRILKDNECYSELEFNVQNQLSKVWNKKGKSVAYEYNGLGHRVKKWVGNFSEKNSMTTIYKNPNYPDSISKINAVFHPEKQINYIIDLTKEYNNLIIKEEDGKRQRYVWDKEIISATDKEHTWYACQDELGSPIRLMDARQKEITYDYDEFGTSVSYKYLVQPFGYTGYQIEEESGLYFAQARYYDAINGRFISKDKYGGFIWEPITLNSYMYCKENPLIYIDANGKLPTVVLGGIVGGLIGGGMEFFNELVEGEGIDIGKIIISAGGGAASGALAGTGVGLVGAVAGNAGISATQSVATDIYENVTGKADYSIKDIAVNGLTNGAIGAVSGWIGGKGALWEHKTYYYSGIGKYATRQLLPKLSLHFVDDWKRIVSKATITGIFRGLIPGLLYNYGDNLYEGINQLCPID